MTGKSRLLNELVSALWIIFSFSACQQGDDPSEPPGRCDNVVDSFAASDLKIELDSAGIVNAQLTITADVANKRCWKNDGCGKRNLASLPDCTDGFMRQTVEMSTSGELILQSDSELTIHPYFKIPVVNVGEIPVEQPKGSWEFIVSANIKETGLLPSYNVMDGMFLVTSGKAKVVVRFIPDGSEELSTCKLQADEGDSLISNFKFTKPGCLIMCDSWMADPMNYLRSFSNTCIFGTEELKRYEPLDPNCHGNRLGDKVNMDTIEWAKTGCWSVVSGGGNSPSPAFVPKTTAECLNFCDLNLNMNRDNWGGLEWLCLFNGEVIDREEQLACI